MSLLTAEWKNLVFANYTVPPQLIEKYLPAHTKPDFYNGKCYLSLVGFQFKNVKVANLKIPFNNDFEEINLRFYVKRFDGAKWRKGVIFISQIADKAALNTLANVLFQENYQKLVTKQHISEDDTSINARYSWRFKDEWQHLEAKSGIVASPFQENSEEEFLMDRPWGYGKRNNEETNEYKVSHPDWPIFEVEEYSVKVDFSLLFGPEFNILSSATPKSVILAEGSTVSMEEMNTIK
ncbi:YqjF family protein [Salinimicrobium sp. GXAS 041]|uniref:YqjF family protein n=1 Tax=Salinimicrobium sp. GXAS 041 TaxID=3400806 RepID=UPI003C7907B2